MAQPLKNTLISKLLAQQGTSAVRATPESSDWLRLLLDETIERDQPFWRPQSTFFRVSSAGEPCQRAMTFSAMGHNVPHEARLLRLFRLGNSVEASNIPTFFDAGILIHPQPGEPQEEVVYYGEGEERMLVGHYDLLIKRRGTEQLWLGEIKSINTNNFKRLPAEADPVANVRNLLNRHPKYVIQWTMYAGSEQVNTPYGFLLFEHKDDSQQRLYSLVVDEDLKARTLERLRETWEFIRDVNNQRVAPVPIGRSPADPRDPVCKWCSAQYLCRRLPIEGATYEQAREEDAKLRG